MLFGIATTLLTLVVVPIVYTLLDVFQRAGSVDKEKIRAAFAATNITSGPATGIMGWQ
jgi:hypothetical protein